VDGLGALLLLPSVTRCVVGKSNAVTAAVARPGLRRRVLVLVMLTGCTGTAVATLHHALLQQM